MSYFTWKPRLVLTFESKFYNYGIIYHVHRPCPLLSYIDILMQIIHVKGIT